MPVEIVMQKGPDGAFHPVTSHDRDAAEKWPVGQGIRVEATQVRPRSLIHHKMYWALINLTLDYWEPAGGAFTPQEERIVKLHAQWLDKETGGNAVSQISPYFLQELGASRMAKRPETMPKKDAQALHQWVKEQAGYYDLLLTPDGVRRQPRSINFNAMGQEEFNEFYKAAFSVCWNLALSRPFASEKDAEDAVNQLMSMG